MKFKLTLAFILLIATLSAQNGVTFKIEGLSKPQELLEETTPYDGNGLRNEQIYATSQLPEKITCTNRNNTMYDIVYIAYMQHRPLVFSPDMIWLMIAQGFANHVDANHEKLRHYFVNFEKKKKLTVDVIGDTTLTTVENILLLKWDSIIQKFPTQIAKYTGEDLINILSADFSTTTITEKIASDITIMKSMDNYFDYEVGMLGCGIPQITLLGTPEDWQKVYDKTMTLSKYELKWWTKELEPILKQFIRASQNDIDTDFWKKLFKYHEVKAYKKSAYADGWFIKFYPYSIKGKRMPLNKIYGSKDLPNDFIDVNLKFKDEILNVEKDLYLGAGFIGATQNHDNYALTPQIAWVVKEKNTLFPKGFKLPIPGENDYIKIKEVPEEVKLYKNICEVKLMFENEIKIPAWMSEIKINQVFLKGKISPEEEKRVIKIFKKASIIEINDKRIKSTW